MPKWRKIHQVIFKIEFKDGKDVDVALLIWLLLKQNIQIYYVHHQIPSQYDFFYDLDE